MPDDRPARRTRGPGLAVDTAKLRTALADRGLTQGDLAEKAMRSKRTVERILKSGTATPRVVLDIATALGLVPGDLAPGRPSHATPAAAIRPNQLPAALADFVGREKQVRELVDRLAGTGGVIGLSAVRGMGGVGKTSLAVLVAHRVRDVFPDGLLFLDLLGMSERPATPAETMAQVIGGLDPGRTGLPTAADKLVPLYRSVLAGRRALVVLDNAAGEAQVRDLITGPPTGFLITSRKALALDGVASVEVDTFSPRQSRTLLRGIVGPKGTDTELDRVADLCGCLPLALRVAGDFLRLKDGWTPAAYIAALEGERLRWLRVGDGQDKDVGHVLRLSAAQLVRDDPGLALRWHYLADWSADFAAAAAAAAWDMDPAAPAVLGDLAELTGRSMVLYDPAVNRYRLHDLMRPIAAGLFA